MQRDELINKHRPVTFDDVIGNAAMVRSLRSVIDKKRSKTFLFLGPAGIGKTTLARISAQTFGAEPGDIIETDAAKYTGVDDMRQLTGNMNYRPLSPTGVKAMILDECHALSKAAWQSLLKILEEPPPWVYWFLCTTDASKVPDTVKTRAARYDLKPVARRELTDFLDRIAGDEKFKASEAVIDMCVRESNGSPRQALAHLALCADVEDRREAAEILRSAEDSSEAVDLARALVRGAGLDELMGICARLKGEDQESVRRVVKDYLQKAILSGNSKDVAVLLDILVQFAIPYPVNDGMTGLLVSVHRAAE